MDVFALIVACSVYPDQALVRAVVELASRGNSSFVGDIATLATYDTLANAHQADRLLGKLEHRGGRPVAGLMGLPATWAQRYARTRKDLFDPCVNLWIGSAILSGHHDACVTSHAAIFMSDDAIAAPLGKARASAAAVDARPNHPASRAWNNVPPDSRPGTPPGDRDAAPPVAVSNDAGAPANAIRACTLRRFGADLGVTGFAEEVMRLLPHQRRLFALPDVTVASFPATLPAPALMPPLPPPYVRDSRFPLVSPPRTLRARPQVRPESVPILD